MKMMNKLIETLKNYTWTKEKLVPKSLKIVLGDKLRSGDQQEDDYIFDESLKCSNIYKIFGPVAFIFSGLAGKSPSEVLVMGLLFGDINKALRFLSETVKMNKEEKLDIYKKLIEYLFCEKGIILINRTGNSNNYKMLKKYKVEDVLIIGSYQNHKRLIDSFPNSRMGTIVHSSPVNLRNDYLTFKYYKTWFLHDDDCIEKLGDLNLTSFSRFKCL